MSAIERLRHLLAPYATHQMPGSTVPCWQVDADGVPLRISVVPEPPHTRVRFEVSLPAWRCDLLIMAAEHTLVSPPRLVSGDVSFDAKVVVCDRDARVLGCFDAPTRALVAALTASGGFVSGGVMVYSALVDTPDIDRTLAMMLAVTKRLGLSEAATVRALDGIARDDPDPRVRARHTRTQEPDGLAAEANTDRSDATFSYLAKRFDDWALPPDMRLDAAERLMAAFPLARLDAALRAAPPEFVAPLADRLCAAIERQLVTPDEASAELVVHFARLLANDGPRLEALLRSFIRLAQAGLLPTPAFVGWLSGLVASDSEPLLKLATRGLCALGTRPALEALARVQSRVIPILPKLAHEHPEIGAAVLVHFLARVNPLDEARQIEYVQAIVAIGDASVEGALADFIGTQAYDVQLELIQALGKLGTLASVPVLKPLTEGWLRDGSIKEAARVALAAVRKRGNVVALPGALSMADQVAGGLALDDD